MLAKEYKEKYPNFKIARGNEIYLVENREPGQKYFHFILIAKDAVGHKMLRELSSNSWINSYFDRGMERVPTLQSELSDIVKKYGKGHLIASSACLGSKIDFLILELNEARESGDKEKEVSSYNNLVSFISYCKELFEDDFYLEVQPATSKEQMTVNSFMSKIGAAFNIKIIVTTDAHYLKKEDRWAHKAFLNSKNGDREVDEFYEFAYLQSTEDVIKNLEGTGLDYYELERNTLEIYDKLEDYTLHKKQSVQEVAVKDYPKASAEKYSLLDKEKHPTLIYLLRSDNIQERYWVNQCLDKLIELNLYNEIYLDRLEEEADIKKCVGEGLETCVFAYPIFLQHYINLFWECGSPIGPGRGCFLPESNFVTLEDGTVKEIQDVIVGDRVRTIDGTSHTVVDTLSYPCNEMVYKISVNGNGNHSLCNTDNHEYYAIKRELCPYDRKFCTPKCKRINCKHRPEFKKEWIRSDELKIGDFVFYPKQKFYKKSIHKFDLVEYCKDSPSHYEWDENKIYNRTSKKYFDRYINVDSDFMYFLGVCIGDGWTCIGNRDGGKIGIAFNNSTEKDIASLNKCKLYLSKINMSYGEVQHKTKKLIQLYCYNKPFASLIEDLIGKGAENKKIPYSLLYDDEKEMLSLLHGLLSSDGSFDKVSPRFSYDSINFNLINQIKMLCSYLGFYTSITTRAAYGNNKTSYKLRACGGKSHKYFNTISPIKYNNIKKDVNNVFIDEDGYWVKITNIETFKYTGKVYDLTVEENHNYIVNNVVVHNSAGGGLNHYLLGITQTDPIKTSSPFFRYMNKARQGMPKRYNIGQLKAGEPFLMGVAIMRLTGEAKAN